MRIRGMIGALVVVWLTFGLMACDQEIDPIATTEMAYSIYGHLNPEADTQWVRVAPFRSTIFNTPDPVDAAVTIQELETGRRIEMVQAPFAQRAPNFGDTLYTSNFLTTEVIEPGMTYRLTSQRSDGNSASGVAAIPQRLGDLPVVVGLLPGSSSGFRSGYVRFPVAAGDHLAMVNTLHYPPDTVWVGGPLNSTPSTECQNYPVFSIYNPLPANPPPGTGIYQVNLRRKTNMEYDPPCQGLWGRWEIRIVRTRERWPFGLGSDNTHINAVNNIENGVGFLGGVITRLVPWETCSTPPGTQIACEMTHGVEATTVVVTTRNGSPPGSGGSFNPAVSLRKVGETSSLVGTNVAPPSSPSPIFRFRSVDPGSYLLRAVVGTTFSFYCEERTLTLVPGEMNLEIVMVPRSAFPDEPVNANGCREG